MIISASRRTDIPAYYADWFYNRVAAGFVLVRNPMNPRQVSRIALNPESVDCFVFWTKNPVNFIERLTLLRDYKFYFQFTITPYEKDVEAGVPDKRLVIDVFRKLSEKIGADKVIWRYDPILLSSRKYSLAYHQEQFSNLCDKLGRYTKKCIISFYDNYRFAGANTKNLELREIQPGDMQELGASFARIAKLHSLQIETCAEAVDLSEYGIAHGRCVDNRMIAKITGCNFEMIKDKNQRELCGCAESVDIGSYSTCLNRCLYCYATRSFAEAATRFKQHNPESPLLFGELSDKDRVTARRNKSLKIHQPDLGI